MTNNKKNNEKKEKDKTDNQKTKADRVMEIVKAWKQLREIGFPDDTPALVEFKRITNLFIEDGIPTTGKIPMDEYDRTLCYILTNRKHKESTIALMANKKN
jgi:hypothetical protein